MMTGSSYADIGFYLLAIPVFCSALILTIISVFAAYDYALDRYAAFRDSRCAKHASSEMALIDQLEQLWRL